MYVCICNAITEKDLRAEAMRSPGDADAVYRALGKEPMCGMCIDEAERVIEEERRNHRLPARV